jgi:hypothetical protein
MSNPPARYSSSTITRPLSEWQYRAAAHFYFYRHVGIASLVWSDGGGITAIEFTLTGS